MTDSDDAVTLVETEHGVLPFGSESALTLVDKSGVVSRPILAKNVARVGAHAGSVPQPDR